MENKILLSFDVEEFDIPEEYGFSVPEKIKLDTSLFGLKKVLELLDKLNLKATFYVTAKFAKENGKIIKEMSKKHEIASHGFYHSSFSPEDLKKSKELLEKIIDKKIIGFRMPRLKKIPEEDILNAGYEYNSSLNPTYLPGRYNNFFEKRVAYWSNGLLNVPTSVTPTIRFPLFWLSFKNFPLIIIKMASRRILNKDNYLNIYFHPWEFTNISKFNLPKYISKNSGKKMLANLEKYLVWLKKEGQFVTFSEFKKLITN